MHVVTMLTLSHCRFVTMQVCVVVHLIWIFELSQRVSDFVCRIKNGMVQKPFKQESGSGACNL